VLLYDEPHMILDMAISTFRPSRPRFSSARSPAVDYRMLGSLALSLSLSLIFFFIQHRVRVPPVLHSSSLSLSPREHRIPPRRCFAPRLSLRCVLHEYRPSDRSSSVSHRSSRSRGQSRISFSLGRCPVRVRSQSPFLSERLSRLSEQLQGGGGWRRWLRRLRDRARAAR